MRKTRGVWWLHKAVGSRAALSFSNAQPTVLRGETGASDGGDLTMGSFGWRLGARAISTVVAFGALFSLLCCGALLYESKMHGVAWHVDGTAPRNQKARTRKLLAVVDYDGNIRGMNRSSDKEEEEEEEEKMKVDRMGMETCTREDVAVYQGATAPLPNGIPTYTVEVLNACATGCAVSNIHVACGWFSSARLINPRLFRRLRFDDCLVNDGHPLAPGQSLSFQYANSFPFPLTVSSLSCH